MKTIKEWLEELPEPYRSKALGYCDNPTLYSLSHSLEGTLLRAFTWDDTAEGPKYWERVSREDYPEEPVKIEKGEFTLEIGGLTRKELLTCAREYLSEHRSPDSAEYLSRLGLLTDFIYNLYEEK